MDRPPEGSASDAALTVVTATRLETRAVHREAPGATVVEAGVGLRRLRAPLSHGAGGAVVACGLAGALTRDLPTGSVVVPDRVLRPGGGWMMCDPALVEALVAASRRVGVEPVSGPLATVTEIVSGRDRDRPALRGCVAVDMETGLLSAVRVAAVRVILDTPDREISPAWRRPLAAMMRPGLWREAAWLYRQAPRCAALAAAILAAALPELRGPCGRRELTAG